MEIAEINILTDFQAGMNCLQNPSFISRFFSFSGIQQLPKVYSFWKWGALIFAFFAAFSSIIQRIKLIFIHLHTVKPSFDKLKDDIFEFSDDDDDLSVTSSDDDDDAEETSPTTSFRGDADFRVKASRLWFNNQGQNGYLRGSWSDFTSAKSVVKLWDSFGLSLDLDEDLFNYDTDCIVSTWGSDEITPSKVFLTAKTDSNGEGLILGGYDTRMRRRVPALFAEWRSTSTTAAASTRGVGKVYVRDGVNGAVTVGDVRNVRRPLESDGETWWDADAVIAQDSD